MSNTAEVIKFPAPLQEQQESHMAELENGYLRIANQIQDALCIVELSGREFRVLNAIIRLTYGWSKKSDRITNSLIADKTALKVKHVSEAVVSLAYRNIIILRRIGQTRYIGINTCLDKWAYTKPNCMKCPEAFPAAEVKTWVINAPEFMICDPRNQGQLSPKIGMVNPENRDGEFTPPTIPENRDGYPRIQGEVSPKTGNTKDILPNTNIKTDLTPSNPPKGKVKFDPLSIPVPEWLDSESWSEWVAYRQQSGKAIKTELTVTKAFKLLKTCLDEGHNPVDVINISIANGYQGLFKPKFPVKPTAGSRLGIDYNNTDWIDGVIDENSL
ncbi:replication protein [Citrobacter werkmanii]|uniref:replication protein n=1 Tax=Citrobacter werkmanii TaxID=67827 RepID=UPI0018FF84FF|nr:replication protein [Citrobacter werkmanii]MBJ9293445.1 replication protein [Citrobacter werkmanii]